MGNYNDYQLEDAEDAAVRKSKNLKRGLAIGGAVIGAGTASAYAATTLNDNGETVDTELTPDDIVGGAQAAADAANEVAEEAQAQAAPAPKAETHKVAHEDAKPQVNVEESTLLYDEDGNYIGAVDEGKIDGKSFAIIDSDGNGKGDIIAYDKNGNGIFEDDEFSIMDNETHTMGKGDTLAVYQRDEWGDYEQVQRGPNLGHQPSLVASRDSHHIELDETDDISDIRNDYQDEKTGEVYHDDLAENNSDYYNKDEAEQYTASVDSNEDYGYTEQTDDLASYDHGIDESYDYQA